jgi:hypothetical protein
VTGFPPSTPGFAVYIIPPVLHACFHLHVAGRRNVETFQKNPRFSENWGELENDFHLVFKELKPSRYSAVYAQEHPDKCTPACAGESQSLTALLLS